MAILRLSRYHEQINRVRVILLGTTLATAFFELAVTCWNRRGSTAV